MNIIQKIKDFFQTPFGRHVHSFFKTYVTVFIGTYLALNGLLTEIDAKALSLGLEDVSLADISIFVTSAKFAFIAVIRNVYKLLTE